VIYVFFVAKNAKKLTKTFCLVKILTYPIDVCDRKAYNVTLLHLNR